MNKKQKLIVLILLLLVTGFSADVALAKEPISFEGIIRLPDFGLDSRQIADQIAESGLAFEVTQAHIDSLRQLGFDSAVINAVRQFYRMGILKITTAPSQVEITVDNEPQGASDRYGIWEMEIPRGIHTIGLKKSGYEQIDTSVTVAKDKTTNMNFSLRQTARSPVVSKFWGRYGASVGYGISITPPAFDDDTKWKSGNNIILSFKANLTPYIFIDGDINYASFSEFDAGEGDDYGFLTALNFSVIPGVYKEFNESVRGYLGLGLELSSTKIENGKFEDDGVAYVLDEKGSKTAIALLGKLGADAFVQENLFLFAEFRGYSVLGQYSMGFIAVGAGIYIK